MTPLKIRLVNLGNKPRNKFGSKYDESNNVTLVVYTGLFNHFPVPLM